MFGSDPRGKLCEKVLPVKKTKPIVKRNNSDFWGGIENKELFIFLQIRFAKLFFNIFKS